MIYRARFALPRSSPERTTHGPELVSMLLLYADFISMAATTLGPIAGSGSIFTTEMLTCLTLDNSKPYVDSC